MQVLSRISMLAGLPAVYCTGDLDRYDSNASGVFLSTSDRVGAVPATVSAVNAMVDLSVDNAGRGFEYGDLATFNDRVDMNEVNGMFYMKRPADGTAIPLTLSEVKALDTAPWVKVDETTHTMYEKWACQVGTDYFYGTVKNHKFTEQGESTSQQAENCYVQQQWPAIGFTAPLPESLNDVLGPLFNFINDNQDLTSGNADYLAKLEEYSGLVKAVVGGAIVTWAASKGFDPNSDDVSNLVKNFGFWWTEASKPKWGPKEDQTVWQLVPQVGKKATEATFILATWFAQINPYSEESKLEEAKYAVFVRAVDAIFESVSHQYFLANKDASSNPATWEGKTWPEWGIFFANMTDQPDVSTLPTEVLDAVPLNNAANTWV